METTIILHLTDDCRVLTKMEWGEITRQGACALLEEVEVIKRTLEAIITESE